MTEQPTEQQAPVLVEPDADSRLAQMHAAYLNAKAAADAAAADLKAITDAIKLELTQAAPEGTARIELAGPAGPRMRLTWSESWRLDSKRLKAEHPEVWVSYAKKGGSWTLKAAPTSAGEQG